MGDFDFPLRVTLRVEQLFWKCPRCRLTMAPLDKGLHEIMGCQPPREGETVGRENPGIMYDTRGA